MNIIPLIDSILTTHALYTLNYFQIITLTRDIQCESFIEDV